jgi:acyl transferase domain-containing protein
MRPSLNLTTTRVAKSPRATSPLPHRPDIHMNEGMAAIVTYASTMQFQGCVAQLFGAYAWHAYINGHGFHVQAMFGHAMGATAQHCVGGRCSIPADNVDLSIRTAQGRGELVQQVKHSRIVVSNGAIARVTQEVVELVDRLRNIGIATAIDHINMFVSVSVIQT